MVVLKVERFELEGSESIMGMYKIIDNVNFILL